MFHQVLLSALFLTNYLHGLLHRNSQQSFSDRVCVAGRATTLAQTRVPLILGTQGLVSLALRPGVWQKGGDGMGRQLVTWPLL